MTSGWCTSVCRGQGREVEVRQGVAVHDEGAVALEQVERAAGAAARAEHQRFPRVADVDVEIAAVSHEARDAGRQVVQIHHHAPHAGGGQPAELAADHRLAGHRQGRFGAHPREGRQARPEACGEQDGGVDHGRPAPKIMSPRVESPAAAIHRLRYDAVT